MAGKFYLDKMQTSLVIWWLTPHISCICKSNCSPYVVCNRKSLHHAMPNWVLLQWFTLINITGPVGSIIYGDLYGSIKSYFWHWSEILINNDLCGSMWITSDQFWWVKIYADLCGSMQNHPLLIRIDPRWSTKIFIDPYFRSIPMPEIWFLYSAGQKFRIFK